MSTERNKRGPKIVTGTPLVARGSGPTARMVGVPATVHKKDPTEVIEGLPLNKLRTSFRPEEFTRVIRQQGYYIAWRKAVLCPCLNVTRDQTDMNCVHCDGSGYYYFDPISTRAIMSRFTRDVKMYEKFGAWVEGSAQITVEPQYRLGFADQIEMQDSVMPFTEVITKNNRRGARSVLPANTDCARYRIVQLTAALWLDDDDNIVTLVEGIHYKLTENGWIEWLSKASSIPTGACISLLYTFHPIFLVMSHNNVIRDIVKNKKVPMPVVTSLPMQATVKLDYLMDIKRPLAALQLRVDKTSEVDQPQTMGDRS